MSEAILPDIPVSTTLEEQLLTIINLRDTLEQPQQELLGEDTIDRLGLTISGSYQQTEVQQIADKVDNILTRLRNAGIIGE